MNESSERAFSIRNKKRVKWLRENKLLHKKFTKKSFWRLIYCSLKTAKFYYFNNILFINGYARKYHNPCLTMFLWPRATKFRNMFEMAQSHLSEVHNKFKIQRVCNKGCQRR